ncbi:transcriptional repressor PurR [Mergibacter septicus]|uniref:substrate-binding domain-containing protein n=1 Tax=Mergibacter septicus TaxID=221402 RepID=UPI00117978E0|nr:substrate-binding domain-containing protein [Mergibacter septicus]AWX13921.1 transcriptional repressor PurR [Mergibacter septicus]
MATMKDIARLAKVSTSTVSHVINNSRFVSEEIREKVLKIVAELNYTPSALARSLKVRETRTLGMLVTASNNPFFAEVIRSVERYCNQHNYNLLLSYTDGDSQRLHKNLQTLIQKQIDGLLLMCTESDWQLSHNLPALEPIPKVVMDWWPLDINADKVFDNSELGGYLATKTLLEQGHRQIAIITGSLTKSLARQRLTGYQKALDEAKITLNPDWIIQSQFDFNGGLAGMQQLLTLKNRPTAVFASSDTIAVGAYQALWQAGLSAGKDLSIIGYDNIDIAQYLSPPLATIHQSKNRLAKFAVQQLIKRIKNPNTPTENIILTPEVYLRDSIQPFLASEQNKKTVE